MRGRLTRKHKPNATQCIWRAHATGSIMCRTTRGLRTCQPQALNMCVGIVQNIDARASVCLRGIRVRFLLYNTNVYTCERAVSSLLYQTKREAGANHVYVCIYTMHACDLLCALLYEYSVCERFAPMCVCLKLP